MKKSMKGEANFSAYCASKFGVIGLTQVVADETMGSGLKIYAVLPGAVNTQLISDIDFGMDPSKLLAPEYLAKKIFKVAEGRRKSGPPSKSILKLLKAPSGYFSIFLSR